TENLVRHRVVVELLHVLDGRHSHVGVDNDVFVLVLDGGAEGPEQRAARHIGVDLVGHPNAHLHFLLIFDPLSPIEQVVPRGWPVREADLLPEALSIVAWVRYPPMAESVPDSRRRVEAAVAGYIQLLTEILLRLLIQIAQVKHARLEVRRRVQQLDQVMTLAGTKLGRSA